MTKHIFVSPEGIKEFECSCKNETNCTVSIEGNKIFHQVNLMTVNKSNFWTFGVKNKKEDPIGPTEIIIEFKDR